jgi:Spy/CpxP family protein refolding chaperone
MTLTGRTGTTVVVAAIVSVCLNLLLAGILVGGRWHGPGGGPFRDMPDDVRSVAKSVFETHKAEFDSRRDAVQQARMKVADVLKADPIDQAQLNQALSELLQQSQAMQQLGHQVMVEVAQKLPPEQREKMADSWAKERFRRKPDSD